MRTVVELLPHDLAVVAALETIGKPVGFVEAPQGALEAVRKRTGPDYMVVYPLNTVRDGSLGDPFADVDIDYQITCVGRLPTGARWLADRVEAALLGVTIAGRSVAQVIPDDDGQVRVDRDIEPAVYMAAPRFTIQTVPT